MHEKNRYNAGDVCRARAEYNDGYYRMSNPCGDELPLSESSIWVDESSCDDDEPTNRRLLLILR
jgi:hypothetical protein